MIFIHLLQFCTLRHPLVQARLGESYVCHGLANAFECSFIHFEAVLVAAQQECTPLVCTEKRALTMQVYHVTLTTRNERKLLLDDFFCYRHRFICLEFIRYCEKPMLPHGPLWGFTQAWEPAPHRQPMRQHGFICDCVSHVWEECTNF